MNRKWWTLAAVCIGVFIKGGECDASPRTFSNLVATNPFVVTLQSAEATIELAARKMIKRRFRFNSREQGNAKGLPFLRDNLV